MSTRLREWTVLSMLEWATEYFEQRNIPDPRLSIEWLLAKVLDCQRLDLYLKFDRPLSPDELDQLRPLVQRRSRHEPLQYILGHTPFHHVDLDVTPDVLIPRIETEQLVEQILEAHADQTVQNVLDIGTGSGCIAIALKKAQPDWTLHGIDISSKALKVASANAAKNEVDLKLTEGDITNWKKIPVHSSFDLIISNPPYVLPNEKKQLEKQVTEYEPSIALFYNDIEQMYGSIIRFAEQHLKSKGTLYLEVHELYATRVCNLFTTEEWDAQIRKDYENKERFIRARKDN